MSKIKENLSNFVIFLFIILSSFAFIFGILKFSSNHSWGSKIIFFSSLSLISFVFIIFLKKKIKDFFVTVIATTYFAFLFVNIYLETKIPSSKVNLDKLIEELDLDFDTRSKIEVIHDLRKKNIDAHPSIYAGLLQIDISGETLLEHNLYPLGGISNVSTVMCNESGSYSIYLSDQFGFNNDNKHYKKDNPIMLIGDSMVHGQCVNRGEDIAGYLQSNGYNAFSFGIASNGPLTELATIKEYANYLKPKIILWFYHPNDIYDLNREMKIPILKNYLQEDFNQNLLAKQESIDNFLKIITNKTMEHAEQLIKENNEEKKNKNTKNIINYKNIRNHLTLHNLRFFLNISSATTDYINFEKVMFLAKKEAYKINATLYFIYLPDMRELHLTKNNKKLDKILKKLDIETLNFTKILKETEDPLSYFPWRRMIHFNKDGYALLGDSIINNILK